MGRGMFEIYVGSNPGACGRANGKGLRLGPLAGPFDEGRVLVGIEIGARAWGL